MKHINIPIVVVLAIVVSLFGLEDAMARGGGGFHGGGGGGFHGGGGGGWSGGRGGDFGGGERGGDIGGRGGEFHGGGDHGQGDHGDHGNHGNHGDHNNNNNSNNNNNTYNVNGYGGGGWGWGAADGAIAGLAVGAAIGSASQPSTVVVDNTTVVQQPSAFPAGTKVTMLPDGCQVRNVDGAPLYQNGPTWYKPYFGSSGVYYEVVPAPES